MSGLWEPPFCPFSLSGSLQKLLSLSLLPTPRHPRLHHSWEHRKHHWSQSTLKEGASERCLKNRPPSQISSPPHLPRQGRVMWRERWELLSSRLALEPGALSFLQFRDFCHSCSLLFYLAGQNSRPSGLSALLPSIPAFLSLTPLESLHRIFT